MNDSGWIRSERCRFYCWWRVKQSRSSFCVNTNKNAYNKRYLTTIKTNRTLHAGDTLQHADALSKVTRGHTAICDQLFAVHGTAHAACYLFVPSHASIQTFKTHGFDTTRNIQWHKYYYDCTLSMNSNRKMIISLVC